MPAVYFCELLSASTMSQLELKNQGNKNGGKLKWGRIDRVGNLHKVQYTHNTIHSTLTLLSLISTITLGRPSKLIGPARISRPPGVVDPQLGSN